MMINRGIITNKKINNSWILNYMGLSVGVPSIYPTPPQSSNANIDLWYYTDTPTTSIILSFYAFGSDGYNIEGNLTNMTLKGLLMADNFQDLPIKVVPITV